MNADIVELLLVEDNDYDAELTLRALKANNLANNIKRVIDGEEALDYIFGTGQFSGKTSVNASPKLVLLDINMPKVNGLEVLAKMKSNPLTKVIPVVMLTSSKEDPDIQKCYKLGANSYIVKPVDFKGFAEAIKILSLYWLLFNQPAVVEKDLEA